MAMPSLSAAAITSWSLTEPPGWMTAVAPAAATASRPSGKGKKASEAATQSLERQNGFHGAELGGVHAAHLAGADAERLAVARVDDGVRFDVLADPPGEEQAAQFFRGGWAPVTTSSSDSARCWAVSASCSSSPPETCLMTRLCGAEWISTRRRFFFAAKRSRASGVKKGRRWLRRRAWRSLRRLRASTFAVDADDAAKGRDGIAASAFCRPRGRWRRWRRRRGWCA